MSIDEIIASLFGPKGLSKPISKGRTQDRVKSAQGYCARNGIDWQNVLLAMTDEQRQQVKDATLSGT